MLTKERYINLKDLEIDLFFLKLLTIYGDYDFCENLILYILTTRMAEG